MHILIIPSWYPTKENPIRGIFFKEQAQALKSFGHKVGVIYPVRLSLREFKFNSKLFLRVITEENEDGIVTLRSVGWRLFPKLHHINTRFLIKDGFCLYENYIKKYGKPDIIHAHSILFGGLIASRIGEMFNLPFIVTEHSTAYARGMIYPWQRIYLREVFAKANKIITVSPQLGDLLSKEFGCSSNIIQYIPNMVDTDFFKPEKVENRNNKEFIFLTISFLTKKKGHNLLLKAFATKFSDDKNTHLWIGGEGEEKDNLMKEVKELGLEKRVKFLGALSREEVRETIRKCNVFVLPSLYETFGVVLIEALACGKPVIATKCGGPEIIVTEKNGYLVSKGNISELANAMGRMKMEAKNFDPEIIRRDCIERFSKEKVISKLTKLYIEVVNNYAR